MSDQSVTLPDTRLMENKSSTLLQKVSDLRIEDQDSYRLAADYLLEVKKIINTIESEFESSIKQANHAHKTILELKAKVISQFMETEKLAKLKMQRFIGKNEPVLDVAGISFMGNWKCEVTEERLIPRDYLIPDLKKLQAITKAMRGETKIPGLRVWKENQISVRGAV